MEPTSDRRFDPHFGAQLLLEIAQERSVEPLLKKIVERAVERTEFVFSQVWLIKKGDLCATCKYRPDCPDQSRCLHLVAGRRRSLPEPDPGKGPQPCEDLNARLPLNFGPLGEAVASGQLKVVRSPDKQPVFAAGFEWMRDERILECGIRPIEFKGDVLGAMVGFARDITRFHGDGSSRIMLVPPSPRALEIQRLKSQLNSRILLAGGGGEAKAFGDLSRAAALKHIVSQVDGRPRASVLIPVRREQAKNWSPMKFTNAAPARMARWCESIAPRFHGSCSKASFLAMSEALLLER
jgi:hypothetical protein